MTFFFNAKGGAGTKGQAFNRASLENWEKEDKSMRGKSIRMKRR